jgi:hydroxyacylglutathione hydrolase
MDQLITYKYEYGGCRITCFVTGGQWKQNTYIIIHKESLNAIVIDPGDNATFIIRQIEDEEGRLTHILLTHPHHDHVGAVSELSEYFGIDCELHKQDVRLLKQVSTYALTFAHKTIAPITRFQPFETPYISEEEPVIRALHTPGHTKGGVCYLFDGFVFTGDTLLNRFIGRTDFPGGSLTDLHRSVTALLAELVDDTLIFPGHGKPWSAGEAKKWWNERQGTPNAHTSFLDTII